MKLATGILVSTLDGTVTCLRESTGQVMWSLNLGRPIFANPLFDSLTEAVYIGCADSKLYAGKSGIAWIFIIPTAILAESSYFSLVIKILACFERIIFWIPQLYLLHRIQIHQC